MNHKALRILLIWNCLRLIRFQSHITYTRMCMVCDLRNESMNQKFINTLSEYHTPVIMLGTLDVKNGVLGQVVFTNLLQSLRMIKSKVDIAIGVVPIPSISAKGKHYDLDMFNLRLTNMKTENRVEVFRLDGLFNQPRYKVIDGVNDISCFQKWARSLLAT